MRVSLLAAYRRREAAECLGALAVRCLHDEIDTYPKPGLVSHRDRGSHTDMDAALLHHSADVLAPFFTELAAAGSVGADMNGLRRIGIAAERAMLAATGGVNTHRGAIFGLGLLVAAAAYRASRRVDEALGQLVAQRWGPEILNIRDLPPSHGSLVAHQYGVGGARQEAAAGFPSVYTCALPALLQGEVLAGGNREGCRIQAFMALLAAVEDTNLLYRGGVEGLAFARRSASDFLSGGGIGQDDWRPKALQIHHQFVERRLSPGGCGDLLAMAVFIHAIEFDRGEL